MLAKANLITKIKFDEASLILSAVNSQNLTELRSFLVKGFSPNIKISNTYPLHEAVKKNNAAMIDLFLEYKADPFLAISNQDAIGLAVKDNKIRII